MDTNTWNHPPLVKGSRLALGIIGQVRSLNRPEMWRSFRDNVIAPARQAFEAVDVFLCLKSQGTIADESARHLRMHDRKQRRRLPYSSVRRAIGLAERRASNETAARLGAARLHFLDPDYRTLHARYAAVGEAQCPESGYNDAQWYDNKQLYLFMAHDSAECFEVMREHERTHGSRYTHFAKLRPDQQICAPIRPAKFAQLQLQEGEQEGEQEEEEGEGEEQEGEEQEEQQQEGEERRRTPASSSSSSSSPSSTSASRVVLAEHTDHQGFMGRAAAERYFSRDRVRTILPMCPPPLLPSHGLQIGRVLLPRRLGSGHSGSFKNKL